MATKHPAGPPCGNNPNYPLSDGDRAAVEGFHTYLVVRAEQRATETDEERADREATERDHARGDHTHCGITCGVMLPTEHLRNFVMAKGYPGSVGALDELLRRARTEAAAQSAPADLPDRLRAVLTERFTSLGNPFSRMSYSEKGPDGWPATHPVSPAKVADVLRELIDKPQQAHAFTPDAPRAPGLCATCGDSKAWHRAADEEQQP